MVDDEGIAGTLCAETPGASCADGFEGGLVEDVVPEDFVPGTSCAESVSLGGCVVATGFSTNDAAGASCAEISGTVCAEESCPAEHKIKRRRLRPCKLITVYIHSMDNDRTSVVMTESTDLVMYLKLRIYDKTRTPFWHIKFSWWGNDLDSERTLKSYNIKNYTVVHWSDTRASTTAVSLVGDPTIQVPSVPSLLVDVFIQRLAKMKKFCQNASS